MLDAKWGWLVYLIVLGTIAKYCLTNIVLTVRYLVRTRHANRGWGETLAYGAIGLVAALPLWLFEKFLEVMLQMDETHE